MNADGRRPLSPDTYRQWMYRWLETCEVHDEHGQPVHLTPHQWRHTFATRLINRDVPQEVIRILLDHESSQMTARYAKITDKTDRRRWEEATKVNIEGERVTLDPDGPLAQAQWAKTRYGMATQTLFQRLLRPARSEELPARQRLPYLPCLPDRPGVPARAPRTAAPHLDLDRGLHEQRPEPGRGDEPAGPHNLDRMIGEIEDEQEGEAADAS